MIVFLANLICALIAFSLVRWAMLSVHAGEPVSTLVGILIGLVVFVSNLGGQFV
jgi:hypothetical protein